MEFCFILIIMQRFFFCLMCQLCINQVSPAKEGGYVRLIWDLSLSVLNHSPLFLTKMGFLCTLSIAAQQWPYRCLHSHHFREKALYLNSSKRWFHLLRCPWILVVFRHMWILQSYMDLSFTHMSLVYKYLTHTLLFIEENISAWRKFKAKKHTNVSFVATRSQIGKRNSHEYFRRRDGNQQ